MNNHAKYSLAGFVGWLMGLNGIPNPLSLLSLVNFLLGQAQSAVQWAELVIPQHSCPDGDPETITTIVEQRLDTRGIKYGKWIEQPDDSTDLVLEVNAKQLDWAAHTLKTTYIEELPSPDTGLFEPVRGIFEGS